MKPHIKRWNIPYTKHWVWAIFEGKRRALPLFTSYSVKRVCGAYSVWRRP